MTNYKKFILTGAASILLCTSLSAQDTSFDLSSQRSEKQDVLSIPGKKIDHHGIIINPTPQLMTLGSGTVDLTGGVQFTTKVETLADACSFLKATEKGVKFQLLYGEKHARKHQVPLRAEAYKLTIGEKGVSIVGYDERGAFYGLQTLRQLIDSPAGQNGRTVPYVTIEDYPDLPNRGVVEGFYGTPWSHEVRLSLIRFYGKFKMNTYIYGPKDDPYHSSPNWRLPYPEDEAKNIRELIRACRENRVDFVWAIHPGADIKWNEEDYKNLVHKFDLMYSLGVRHYAIFFDDISGEGTNPLKQTELLNRLTDDFVKAKGDVSPLTVCPTDYTELWANPTEQGSLMVYGKTLNPEIKVFWTGAVVCSDLTPSTLNFVNSRIKRPAYYWWNYPVTDYVRHILLQAPVYGLDTTLTAQETCGVLSNPMEHGEASKLALYGVADYTWKMSTYNPIDNWERALVYLMPQASDAYRTFAIHSADTETGYRRDESWETQTFRLAHWDEALATALENEYKKVEAAPAQIEKGATNKGLLQELRPWLTEFGKLGTRGKRTIALARLYRTGTNDAAFWGEYVQNLMSAEDRKLYDAHKSGTMKLQPFYEYAMDDMAHGFLQRLTGKTPKDYKAIGSFANATQPIGKLMLDGDSTTHYTSAKAQKAGDWIGVDLREVRDVREVSILQGRNSVNDVDYFDHAIVEYSADGKTWLPLTGELEKQYVISWKGDAVQARYVRLKRLDSKRTNYAAVRSFTVNLMTIEEVGFQVEASAPAAVLSALDSNLATAYKHEGKLGLEVKKGTTGFTFLMNRLSAPIKCQQLNAKGKVIAESELTDAYADVKIADKKVTKIVLDGSAEIFEIIVR